MKQNEIPIGKKFKFQGKQGICQEYVFGHGGCDKCILEGTNACGLEQTPCFSKNRADRKNVFFPAVKVAASEQA